MHNCIIPRPEDADLRCRAESGGAGARLSLSKPADRLAQPKGGIDTHGSSRCVETLFDFRSFFRSSVVGMFDYVSLGSTLSGFARYHYMALLTLLDVIRRHL